MGKKLLMMRMKNSKKAIIVREPMERLASCYNDKMIEPAKNHLFPKNIKKLREKVRKKAAKLHNGHKPREISFNDFLVTKVINGRDRAINDMSKHWAPYYKSCSPCSVGLDYIVRLDPSMEETKVSFWATQGIFYKIWMVLHLV